MNINIFAAMAKHLSCHFRKKRFKEFLDLVDKIPKSNFKILDIGGTVSFWEKIGYTNNDIEIIIVNLTKEKSNNDNIKTIIGNACDLSQFNKQEFDIVFSNSVIEHVGNEENQKMMAKEIQRLGKQYFIQTPNYWFPIEPHYLLPFFQFIPYCIKKLIINYCKLGWPINFKTKEKAINSLNSIRLLKKKDLKLMFPNAVIKKEDVLFFTKSYMIIG
jgi:2-polyprenyl-3-methyl-5-hydroxy-6-metoxy-1,4-benzoquinol methylase